MKNKLKALAAATVITLSFASQAQVTELSLKEAIELSAKGNRPIQSSRLEVRKSEEFTKEMRSYLKPSISGSASYAFFAERPVIFLRDESSGKSLVNGVQVGGRNAFAAAISGQYPIYNRQIQGKIQLASIQTELQNEKTNELSKSIALRTGELYLAILFYREQMTHLQNSKERNEQSLKDSRMLFLQGKALKTDTLSNSIAVQNLNGAIFNLSIQIESASLRLKQLLGLDEDEELILTDKLQILEDPSIFQRDDSLKSIAFTSRSDIKLQQLQAQYHEQELKTVRSESKPQLAAVAQYQLQSQSDQFSFWKYQVPRTSFVGLQLSIPIYSGSRQKIKEAQIHYSLHQSKLEIQETERQIHTELSILKAEIQDAYQQAQTQKRNIEAAQVNYEMYQDRYKYGLSTRLELTDAELALTQAKINHSQAVYSIRLKQLQLQKALGL